jgi:hypothetical protein
MSRKLSDLLLADSAMTCLPSRQIPVSASLVISRTAREQEAGKRIFVAKTVFIKNFLHPANKIACYRHFSGLTAGRQLFCKNFQKTQKKS